MIRHPGCRDERAYAATGRRAAGGAPAQPGGLELTRDLDQEGKPAAAAARRALGALLLAGAALPSSGCTAELWNWANEPGVEIWPPAPVVVRAADGLGTWVVCDLEEGIGGREGRYGLFIPADWHKRPLVKGEGGRMELKELPAGDWKPLSSLPGPAQAIVLSPSAPPGVSGGAAYALRRRNAAALVLDEIYAWHPTQKQWVLIATARTGMVRYRSTWGRKLIAVLATPLTMAVDVVFGVFIIGVHSGLVYY